LKRTPTICCFALPLLLLQLAGCTAKQEEPASPIIQSAEKAGSGDLSNSSAQAMEQWLGKHRTVSDTIEGMCKPVRQTANAQWAESTEGRLCSAAHDLAFFRSAPATGDGKAFRPGTH
jgi:hypothetical protein